MPKASKPERVEELEMQVAALTEALQRERADAVNLRRRFEEEKSAMADRYKAHILRELLPAVDNLELALKHVPKDLEQNNYVKGVASVAKLFDDSLAKLGLKRIQTVGEHFDPHIHEAVHMDDSEGENEIVSEELQSGWMLGDEVIRPATVKVKRT